MLFRSARPAAAPAERKRKKRTGVKIAEAAPAIPTAAPAAPSANPLDFHAPAPPVAATTLDQIDVELVDVPDPPKRKGFRPTLRDALMVGVGVGLMLIVSSFCWVVSLAVSWFTK